MSINFEFFLKKLSLNAIKKNLWQYSLINQKRYEKKSWINTELNREKTTAEEKTSYTAQHRAWSAQQGEPDQHNMVDGEKTAWSTQNIQEWYIIL
jgi:hypothetical protein